MSHPQPNHSDRRDRHGGHGRMMIACCAPMLLLAVVLVATGVLGFGLILAAIVCIAMMAMMMSMMSGENQQGR